MASSPTSAPSSNFTLLVRGTPLMGLARRLVEIDLLSKDDARDIVEKAHKQKISFFKQVVADGRVDRAQLLKCAAQESGMPLLDLKSFDLFQRPDDLVDGRFLESHGVLPLFKRGTKVFLAVPDPSDMTGVDAFKFQSGFGAEAILVDPDQLARVVRDIASGISAEIADLDEDTGLETFGDDAPSTPRAEDVNVDTPVVRFVQKIFMDAIRQKASDIHIEPYEGKLRIRYRLDGVLHEIGSPPAALAPRIAARVKILSHLDIAERRVPQDGRMKMRLSKGHEIDFRVSTLPTQFGEKVVIRVLDSSGAELNLEALGFEHEQYKLYEEAIRRPYGMILVTGPTGSGKTVSLYSEIGRAHV